MNFLARVGGIVRTYAVVPVALVCLGALGVFFTIGYRSILGPILGATIGAILAVFLLNVYGLEPRRPSWEPPDYRVAGVVTSLYIVAILTMYRFVLHERPVVHYLVFGAFAAYIAYEIACGARRARVVPQLLVLTFFTYWSVQLAFPAGMNEPDTRGKYLPAIREALTDGTISGWDQYIGHLVYVLETVLVTGMSPKMGYFLIATLVLSGTVLAISMLDIAFPAIPREVSLYGALFFGCMAWTLGRGFHPSKLNFFYGLTLFLGIAVVIQYGLASYETRWRWTTIGAVVAFALFAGHRFSAGAAMVFISSIAMFVLLAAVVPGSPYSGRRVRPVLGMTFAYVIAIVGAPFHGEPMAQRFVSLLLSIFASAASGGTGGPGRYSELSTEVLMMATSGEAILFALGIIGAAIAVRRARWEYDLLLFWMAIVSALLAVSLVFNAADVQPQRFYSLLGLFGLNICAGIALITLVRSNVRVVTPHTVAVVVFAFAVLSLGSPVASMHLSFIADDVPHARWHDEKRLTAGNEWVNEYESNANSVLRTTTPSTDLPYERSSGLTATVRVSEIDPGGTYAYTQVAAETGVQGSQGLGLGDRVFVFLEFDPPPEDDIVYENGDTTVLRRAS